MSVHFEDNSNAIKAALEEALSIGLHKAADMVHGSLNANSKAKYNVHVDETTMQATFEPSDNETAINEEFGKGEYCVPKENRLHPEQETIAPTRPLQNSIDMKRNVIAKTIGDELKNL